jgi:hypothetical protein
MVAEAVQLRTPAIVVITKAGIKKFDSFAILF